MSALTARYYANTAADYLRPKRRQGVQLVLTEVWEHHHPKGLVGIVSPWNYPLTLGISDALPALVAGNAVLAKPDRQTPFSASVGGAAARGSRHAGRFGAGSSPAPVPNWGRRSSSIPTS